MGKKHCLQGSHSRILKTVTEKTNTLAMKSDDILF